MDRLQFEKTAEVQDGDNLAFAALQQGSVELMYGSYASLEKNGNAAKAFTRGTGFLFLDVDDLDSFAAAMQGASMVAPMHKTSYGSTEFGQ
jgi:uncharacterized glyoxalase superfamily protein PhnB